MRAMSFHLSSQFKRRNSVAYIATGSVWSRERITDSAFIIGLPSPKKALVIISLNESNLVSILGGSPKSIFGKIPYIRKQHLAYRGWRKESYFYHLKISCWRQKQVSTMRKRTDAD